MSMSDALRGRTVLRLGFLVRIKLVIIIILILLQQHWDTEGCCDGECMQGGEGQWEAEVAL